MVEVTIVINARALKSKPTDANQLLSHFENVAGVVQ